MRRKPITVDINGNVRVCNHSPVIAGNIYEKPLYEILHSDYVESWNNIIPEICKNCNWWEKCRGGCRAASEQIGTGLAEADPVVHYKYFLLLSRRHNYINITPAVSSVIKRNNQMKYKALLITILIFCRAGFTFAEVNQAAWEQGLAVLAKNVNINSLKSKPAIVNQLQNMPARYSVNDIKTIVKDYRLNLDICDNILSLADKHKDFSSENNAKRYLSDDIFNYQLRSFAAKRQPEELEKLKQAIKEDLDIIPNWETTNKNESNEYNDENQSNDTSEIAVINPQENISQMNNPQKDIPSQKNGSDLSNRIPFLLSITSLILLIVIAYLLWVLLKKEINKQHRKIKQNLEFIDEAKANQTALKKLEDRINELSYQLKALDVKQSKADCEVPVIQPYPAEFVQKKRIEEPLKQIEEPAELPKKEVEEPLKQIEEPAELPKKDVEEQFSLYDFQLMPTEFPKKDVEALPITQPKPVETPVESVMQTYYLAVPNYAGVFQVYHEEYQYGKSIYLMKTSDEQTGTFSVLEDRASCVMALTAPNLFLLPACSVVGDRPDEEVHQTIITESEGTVTKEGKYWKVSEKAIIRCK